MEIRLRKLSVLFFCLLLMTSAIAQKRRKAAAVRGGLPSGAFSAMHDVDDDRIKTDIKYLSSDRLEGRGTGAPGGDAAADYVAEQFQKAGVKPAGEQGTYFQKVPMVGISTKTSSTFSLLDPKQALDLKQLDDVVLMDESQQPSSDLHTQELVFVGYGITAPEFQWDDYAGVDVKGKVLLMLVNEPPSDDPKYFNGKALTYYGRWTYKYEHAAKMGAAGVILIHKREMASYGWEVVRSSWSGERSYLAGDQDPKLHLAAWIQLEIARKMLTDCGQDLDQMINAAGQKGFKATTLPIELNAHLDSTVRPFESRNVIAKVEGSDSALKDQAVFFTAHYDHLGIRPDMQGDNIYNGANDNASGTAMVIEMARAAAASTQKPKRSLYFAAVTAEEQGLWGSNYLAKHPPVPADRISLDLNFDSFMPLGIPKEVTAGGYDRTNFAPMFEKTAADFGMKILPPEHPENGGYYRSDHFSFARQGVPAFSINEGGKFEGETQLWVTEHAKKIGGCYHQTCDEFVEDGDYRSNAVMARFGLALGYKAADMPGLVKWKAGDEFAAARKVASKP
jgi:Zn-dependent M28 family amino/carboxypeptidase